MNANEPLIIVTGGSSVSIDPINTLDDLAVVSAKFAKIIEAEAATAVCTLVTAVGDLSFSVANGDSDEGFAEEIADVLIATMVVAAKRGIGSEQICSALRSRFAAQTGEAISQSISKLLARRGMNNFSR